MQNEAKYLVIVNGSQSGPYTAQEITESERYREIKDIATVWCEGMDNWKPLKEVIQIRKIPLHPDIEKHFPSNLFIGDRKNTWLEKYNQCPNHFDRLKSAVITEDPVLGFMATSGVGPDFTTKYSVVYAITAKRFWIIWNLNATTEKQLGFNEIFPGFEGKTEENYELDNPKVSLEFQKQSGFFSIDGFRIETAGNLRFLSFTGVNQCERDDFFNIISRMGFREHVKESDKKDVKSGTGCLVFFVPLILGGLIYGFTKI